MIDFWVKQNAMSVLVERTHAQQRRWPSLSINEAVDNVLEFWERVVDRFSSREIDILLEIGFNDYPEGCDIPQNLYPFTVGGPEIGERFGLREITWLVLAIALNVWEEEEEKSILGISIVKNDDLEEPSDIKFGGPLI